MAIGPDNQVTTTGLLNKPSVNIAAPDMSGLGPTQQTQKHNSKSVFFVLPFQLSV